MSNHRLLLLSLLLLPPGLARAEAFHFLPYTSGHMDIGPRVVQVGDQSQVTGFWKNDFADVNGQMDSRDHFNASELRALGVFDENTPPVIRPAGSEWDFFGVGAGEPIYILPAGGDPNTVPYLGFSTEDGSLSSVHGLNNIKVSLVKFSGPEGAVSTVYLNPSTIPMNSANDPMGHIDIGPGDHLHFNWSFSHPGTYDLTFLFELLDANDNVLLSGEDTFRFQITDGGSFDDYEHWRRTHFHPDDIGNEAISGPDIDAGVAVGTLKGFTNEQRYAFGNHPRVDLERLDDGAPAIRLPMRVGMGDLETGPEQTGSLTEGTWNGANLILEATESIFHDPGLEIRTYRIDEVPSGPSFFRAGAWQKNGD